MDTPTAVAVRKLGSSGPKCSRHIS
jgi:hypothetical protein